MVKDYFFSSAIKIQLMTDVQIQGEVSSIASEWYSLSMCLFEVQAWRTVLWAGLWKLEGGSLSLKPLIPTLLSKYFLFFSFSFFLLCLLLLSSLNLHTLSFSATIQGALLPVVLDDINTTIESGFRWFKM